MHLRHAAVLALGRLADVTDSGASAIFYADAPAGVSPSSERDE